MYFTNDSMLPENQQPLIITVAPYGPQCGCRVIPMISQSLGKNRLKGAVDCYTAEGVQACNLGVPILAAEIAELSTERR